MLKTASVAIAKRILLMLFSRDDNPNSYPVGTVGDEGECIVEYDPETGHHAWRPLKPPSHKASKVKKEE